MPVAVVQTGLMVLVALAAVAAFRLVGVVLVMAMLVAPAATAALIVQRVPLIMVLGGVFGLLAVVIGLYASFHTDVAGGPAIVVTSVALFLIVFAGLAEGAGAGAEAGLRPLTPTPRATC